MARRQRASTPLNLSFLDIMSCGFGAVVLLFLVIKHNMDNYVDQANTVLLEEVRRMEAEASDDKLELAASRQALKEVEGRLADSGSQQALYEQTLATRQAALRRLRALARARKKNLERLRSEITELEEQAAETADLNVADDRLANAVLSVTGEGQRQYLTGLRVNGDRILILLDHSASMLDETIVNIIRRRNMSPERQREAPKWRQATETLRWLAARLPPTSRFQIYTFSEDWAAALTGTEGRWLDVLGGHLPAAVERASSVLPAGGTNLYSIFSAVSGLAPLPDNILLITDGLPTRAATPPRHTTVTGPGRLRLFDEAVAMLPAQVPVNILLLHLEGDPMAASSYWRLAVASSGSFLAPARDWP